MFSSSVRRVASTAPSTPIASSFSHSAHRAATSQALSYRSHQRRYSSSKPSSPADGSRGVNNRREVLPYGEVDGDKKRRKKAANGKGKDEAIQNLIQHLPCVPSTDHIEPREITASDFFSLYRPISLTNSFPKAISDEAFAAIFTTRTKSNTKPSDVISTLSRTVENLDMITGKMRQLKMSTEPYNDEDDMRAAVAAEIQKKQNVQHLDSAPENASMNFPHHILSGKYRPFHPPPAPVPESTTESLLAGAEAAQESQESHRTYTAVLTISESTDENGDVTYHAHSTPLIADRQQRRASSPRFLSRMQGRQEQYWIQRSTEYEGMLAISVKRQRKLKMKKHKYKKLMRRTRNLRRRLDRN
ncbi:hypothetical protein LSUE1_G005016 [Lachnellula suecica]|uniref:Small ribosomal subunit protein mS38 n=1 Tax=Lachnellula suecica TaxID=602035 RepID=A0A8T9C8E5_9HELO|nr:hypothetical protein LSUE1_G005016 [Lachnellula suecica]